MWQFVRRWILLALAPALVEGKDFVDRRRLALQLRSAAHAFRVLADQLQRQQN